MSELQHHFVSAGSRTVVSLPFELDALVSEWVGLRSAMIRQRPDAFTRDEWAYLIAFLDRSHLLPPFTQAFGEVALDRSVPLGVLARPRGEIAVWLPNNVSLLGPLMLILLSLTGNRILAKGASQTDDLTAPFVEFVRAHGGDLLVGLLSERLRYERFDRGDQRNEQWAARAQLRIVFGSDEGARAIDGLPHPLSSDQISFSDRRSEAWIEPACVDDALCRTLIKVFAIYGQAGCTSPSRVILLDASVDEARAFRDRLCALWPEVLPAPPPMHLASASIMSRQWAATQGWDARTVAQHAAVVATGTIETPLIEATMLLPIVAASRDVALAHLPGNIQTLGYAVAQPESDEWLQRLSASAVKRWVPLAQMHHFGPIWDGLGFWQQAFELVEIAR